MYQTPVEAFGGLPYPDFPHLLFACFPLLVLVICVHVVSADSVAPGMLGVGLGAASSLLKEAASGLTSLFSRGPMGAPKALRQTPALVLLIAPLISFCCFRLLPLLLRSDTTAASDFWVVVVPMEEQLWIPAQPARHLTPPAACVLLQQQQRRHVAACGSTDAILCCIAAAASKAAAAAALAI
ncbi:hypothetical protein ACSSS7_000017 [Eimeria intestinalis]